MEKVSVPNSIIQKNYSIWGLATIYSNKGVDVLPKAGIF